MSFTVLPCVCVCVVVAGYQMHACVSVPDQRIDTLCMHDARCGVVVVDCRRRRAYFRNMLATCARSVAAVLIDIIESVW